MMIQEFYKTINGSYEDVLTRLPKDELILRFLKRFPSEGTYEELVKAVDEGDIVASFEASHKLKGIVGNLGFTELFRAVSDLTEQLRAKKAPVDPALFARVKACYETVIEGIGQLSA